MEQRLTEKLKSYILPETIIDIIQTIKTIGFNQWMRETKCSKTIKMILIAENWHTINIYN